jgi:hypothetical protein
MLAAQQGILLPTSIVALLYISEILRVELREELIAVGVFPPV